MIDRFTCVECTGWCSEQLELLRIGSLGCVAAHAILNCQVFLLLFILKVVLLSCLSDARCCYSPVAASEGTINTAVLTAIFCVVWVGDPCSKLNWNWKLALRIVGQRFSCPHILYYSLAWAFNESKILEKGKWHGPTHHEAAVSMQPTPDPFSWPLPLSFP